MFLNLWFIVYAGKETTKYPYRHYFRAKWQQLAAKGSEMALKRLLKPPEGTYLCIRAAGKRARR